jgi:orotate phosphoribosyltransferase
MKICYLKGVTVFKNKAEWLREYAQRRAFWVHDWNPKRPHVELSSGLHSEGYFESELVLKDAGICFQLSYDLFEVLVHEGLDIETVDHVVGAQDDLSFALSFVITSKRNKVVFSDTPKKVGDGTTKKMIWEHGVDLTGKNVLLCDDVFSTGGTIDLLAKLVEESGGLSLIHI